MSAGNTEEKSDVAELDALMALGELASAGPTGPDPVVAPTEVPVVGAVAKEDLQKWVQCCSCERWRRVPYSIEEDQIPDSWTCADNLWDSKYNSCEVEQALSDDRIDEILAQQEKQELLAAQQQQRRQLVGHSSPRSYGDNAAGGGLNAPVAVLGARLVQDQLHRRDDGRFLLR